MFLTSRLDVKRDILEKRLFFVWIFWRKLYIKNYYYLRFYVQPQAYDLRILIKLIRNRKKDFFVYSVFIELGAYYSRVCLKYI